MQGETNLEKILKTLQPELQKGEYVFCTVEDLSNINIENIICLFKEKESTTIILEIEKAKELNLEYSFVASWITLNVQSSLEAVGLTAAFANALSQENISCNVVAAFYHDHIFVYKNDAAKAMKVLEQMGSNEVKI
jgi:uncharacterized protein